LENENLTCWLSFQDSEKACHKSPVHCTLAWVNLEFKDFDFSLLSRHQTLLSDPLPAHESAQVA